MKQFKDAIKYQGENGPVYDLWKILYILQDKLKMDFWDYYGSDNNFNNWCIKNNIKVTVKNRRDRNLFARYQADIKSGVWVDQPYCCFIDILMDQLPDATNCREDDLEETMTTSLILFAAQRADKEEFGSDNWRVKCAQILVNNLDAEVHLASTAV